MVVEIWSAKEVQRVLNHPFFFLTLLQTLLAVNQESSLDKACLPVDIITLLSHWALTLGGRVEVIFPTK